MIFPNIYDIRIVGVFDRGIPNEERIVFKAETRLNLSEFGVMIGLLGENNLAAPYLDHLFHFKEIFLIPNSWVFLYTGPGKDFTNKFTSTGEPYYVFHWGKPSTIFAHSQIIPILFRIGGVQLGQPPNNLPQIEGSR